MPTAHSPSLTIGGVTCTILIEDGVAESWPEEGGGQADLSFKCAYANRYALVKALRGYVTTAGTTIAYFPPYRYPPSPNMVCTAIGTIRGIKPHTDSTGWLQYKEAIVPAHFSTPTWQGFPGFEGSGDPSGELFTTTKFKVSSEVFNPPGGSYYYTAGPNSGQAVEESSLGFIRTRCEISMTRHRFPFVPLAAMMSLEGGAVNAAAVTFADKVFPRGCLLFAGFNSTPEPDPVSGELFQEIELTLLGNNDVEWNAFMDRKGTYRLINTKADGSGAPPFQYVDFETLFGLSF